MGLWRGESSKSLPWELKEGRLSTNDRRLWGDRSLTLLAALASKLSIGGASDERLEIERLEIAGNLSRIGGFGMKDSSCVRWVDWTRGSHEEGELDKTPWSTCKEKF